MNKVIKFLAFTIAGILGGLAMGGLISLIGGFSVLKLASTLTYIGLLISSAGAIIIISTFVLFARKVKKTPKDIEVEPDEKVFDIGIKYDYALLLAGFVVLMIAYLLVT